MSKKKRLFGILLALPPLLLGLLYGGGYIAQFMRNYHEWEAAGGTPGNGTSPTVPSFAVSECLRAIFTMPYGIVGILICVGALVLLIVMVMRMGYSETGEYDKDRNFIYSKKGTYGTSGFMSEKEAEEIFDLRTSLKNHNGTIFGLLNGRYVCMPEESMLNKNVAVYGASGSMKTRAYCINRILQATVPNKDGKMESLIICDPKSELYEKTSELLRKTHTVKVFNLVCPENSDSWNCLAEIEGDELMAQRFTDSNLNHTGIYLYSKGKIMIHLTFDYQSDEGCTTPGQYLRYHRTFQGLTTRELAEKVGVVPATLVLYENDRHPIKHSTAVALANVLGIDRSRLLDEYTVFVDYPYSSLLKKVRRELSFTQMQMAEVIGIGQTTYSGWEREVRVPRRKEHEKILAAMKKLKVDVDTYLCQPNPL